MAANGFQDPFTNQPYDGRRHLAWLRSIVTLLVLLCFISIVAYMLHAAPDWNAKKEMMQIIFPAATSIVGTVVGFYFGSEQRR